jgi:hypothetical protein
LNAPDNLFSGGLVNLVNLYRVTVRGPRRQAKRRHCGSV